jgi:hypothetical protein
MVGGKPTRFDPNDEKNPVYGNLFVGTELKDKDGNNVKVKSGSQILKESTS